MTDYLPDYFSSQPVSLSGAERDEILADGETALDSIVADGGNAPPVGVWQQMYKDIDAALGGAGILSGWGSDQEYWYFASRFRQRR